MKVWILIEYGYIDSLDKIIGIFASLDVAQGVMESYMHFHGEIEEHEVIQEKTS